MSNKTSAERSDKKDITPSEAVYGFTAWLTTRDEPSFFGAEYDSGAACSLVAKWCETNRLEPPREGVYPSNLVFPTADWEQLYRDLQNEVVALKKFIGLKEFTNWKQLYSELQDEMFTLMREADIDSGDERWIELKDRRHEPI